MLRKASILLLFCIPFIGFSQKRPIKIVDEIIKNRLNLFALNENLKDYDIIVTIKGTGFRQRGGKPRKIRIPATSKIKVASLVIEKDKTPQYTYYVEANDSLSRRAIRPEATPIKIDPKKVFIVYTSDICNTCDSLVSLLDKSIYIYKKIDLSDNTKNSEQLEKYVPNLYTITNPIINIEGYIYTEPLTFDEILKKLKN